MEEKIMHLLITEDDMALAQGLQRALQEKNRQVLCCKNIQETRQHLHQKMHDFFFHWFLPVLFMLRFLFFQQYITERTDCQPFS